MSQAVLIYRRSIRILLGLFAVAVIISLRVAPAWAYPEFISIGYKSCLTCHYSGNGGGALNDYGRALFAGEIAAKPFYNAQADDEKLAECSQFLGCKQSSHWFKPGYKYRRLLYSANPSARPMVVRDVTMQSDLNVASFTNEEATFGLIATLGYLQDRSFASPNRPINESKFLMREYYFRMKGGENSWWYLGFMDKAHGLRHADHTSYNRSEIRVGQNDQVHGLIYHFQNDNHEFFVQPFAGNLHLGGDQQAKGLTTLYEYSLGEKSVLGFSLRHETSLSEMLSTGAAHTRIGYEGGHALLFELGLKNRKAGTADSTFGFYDFLELSLKMSRGLHFQSILQMEQSAFNDQNPMNMRWGFGLLYFPMQRIEFRMQLIESRQLSALNTREDRWNAQAQLHLSL